MAGQSSKAGTVLTVLGILILVLSGGCTLFYFVLGLTSPDGNFFAGAAIIIGALPILIGFSLVRVGAKRAKLAQKIDRASED